MRQNICLMATIGVLLLEMKDTQAIQHGLEKVPEEKINEEPVLHADVERSANKELLRRGLPCPHLKAINEVIKGLANVAASTSMTSSSSSIRIPPPTSSPLRETVQTVSCGNPTSSSRRRRRRLVPPTRIFSVTPSPPRAFGPTPAKSLPSRNADAW